MQENAFKSHDAILQACRVGDAVEATVLLYEHMVTALRRLDRFLQQEEVRAPESERSTTLFMPLINRRVLR